MNGLQMENVCVTRITNIGIYIRKRERKKERERERKKERKRERMKKMFGLR